MRRRTAFTLATALIAGLAGSAVVVTAPFAQAATGCRVDYRTDQWTGGFTGYLTVNVGDTAAHGWTVTWSYPAGQQITSFWNAQVTQSAAQVSASNVSWNGEVPAGSSVEFGVQGTSAGSNPAPTDFAVNGVSCSGAAATPSASASATPTASPSVTPSVSPSATASPPTSSACGSAQLCDDFETQAGTAPSGNWSVVFPDCQGTGAASVDSTLAHSGTRSVRINGAAGFCNHVFMRTTTNLSAVGTNWFARFYVRHTTALPAAHVTFVAMNDAADGDRDLRMGGQNAALQWNRESDDATLPEQSPAGVALSTPLPTDQWTCVEFNVNGSTGTMSTWVNGTEVVGLHEDGVATQNIDSQWLNRAGWRPSLNDLKLGWESYGDGADTLWYDDVALGSTRIGC